MTSFFILVFHYIKKSRFLCSLLLLAGAFTLGSLLGILTGTLSPTKETSASVQSASWGLSFQEEGKRPAGNATIDDLKQYNAYYASDTDEKILYLTFDAGYENGIKYRIFNLLIIIFPIKIRPIGILPDYTFA